MESELFKRFRFDFLFGLIILCFSIVIVFAQYPGYLLWGDSFVRWEFAKAITEHGIGFDYGNGGFQNWHSTFPTVLMAAAYKLSGGVGFFSFAQCLLVLCSIYLSCRMFSSCLASLLVVCAFILIPVNLVFLVMHMPDALLPGFALLLVAALSFKEKMTDGKRLFIYYAVVYLLFLICVWVRPNFAVVVVPVAYFISSRWKVRLVNLAALMMCSIISIGIWDRVLQVNNFDVSSVAMASEIVGMSKATDGAFCSNCLDFVGDTQNARNNYKVDDVNQLLWDGDSGGLPSYKVGLKQNAKEVRTLWLSALYNNPIEYLKIKISQVSLLMGVERPVKFMFGRQPIDVQRTESACNCKVSDSSYAISSIAEQSFSSIRLFAGSPIVQFAIGLAAVVLLRRTKVFSFVLCCFVLSVFYYVSFFIQMQRVEFRYFYPSWVLLIPVWMMAIFAFLERFSSMRFTFFDGRHV